MRRLYDILFGIFFVLSSPYYFFRMWRRGNWAKGFGQRFGDYDRNLKQSLTNRQVVWLHAVSVGEMNICVELVKALEARLPNIKFVVSTTTTTGMAELQRKLPQSVGKVYYPIDRRRYVSWALSVIHPLAVIIVETEIWPNFIWRAQDSDIPMFLANARLSDKSYGRYLKLGFLFRPLFASFAGVGAQTGEYAQKLVNVGSRREAVRVTGNLKFDTVRGTAQKHLDARRLLDQCGVAADALIIVAGSTHAGEEALLAGQCRRLRAQFPKLFLVLVPRHFERASDAERAVTKAGLKVMLRSNITADTKVSAGAIDCLLVDTTGELMSFYETATVAFVGKSVLASGGQNPIEPAALGKPVVFGPHMENFRDIVRLFLSRDGAVQVNDAASLENEFRSLLSNSARREQLGKAARQVVEENQGATARTVEMILPFIAERGTYVAPS